MNAKFRILSLVIALVTLTPTLAILPAGAATKEKVSITLKTSSITTGQTAHIVGSVTPRAPGKVIKLQRFYGNAWHGYQAKKLTTKSSYDFAFKMTKAGAYTFRVASPHAVSKGIKLSVVARRTPNPPSHGAPAISPR